MRASTSWVRVARRVAAVLLMLLFVPTTALAQSDQDKATARRLAIDGQKALEAKDYAKAADLFGRANQLYKAPTLTLGLARSYAGLGKLVEAQEAYNRLIREKVGDSAAFKQAQEDARKEVAGLDGRIGWVIINVKGPDKPKVSLDDTSVSPASLGIKRAVNPGAHVVTASADGYKGEERKFNMKEGGSVEITLELEKGSGGPSVGPAPAPGPVPTPAPGGGDDADPGATQRLVGIIGMGVGGASLLVGAITGGMAMGAHGDLETNCPGGACPASEQDNLDSFRTLGGVSTATFIVGGVLAAGGLVVFLTAPSADDEPAASAKRRAPQGGWKVGIGPGSVNAALSF